MFVPSSCSKPSGAVTLYCGRRITLIMGSALLGVLLLLLAGCDNGAGVEGENNDPTDAFGASCAIPTSNFADGGVGKDGIPALTDPTFVDAAEADYLAESDRVMGLRVDGQAYTSSDYC